MGRPRRCVRREAGSLSGLEALDNGVAAVAASVQLHGEVEATTAHLVDKPSFEAIVPVDEVLTAGKRDEIVDEITVPAGELRRPWQRDQCDLRLRYRLA